MSREKQIDGATLAVLNCYRNKYYADGNNTEQGIVANAINDVLPTLVEFKNGCYRKQSEGEWIDLYKGEFINPIYVCSLCGKGTLLKPHINELHNMEMEQALSPFCPNCGAKMKGGAE